MKLFKNLFKTKEIEEESKDSSIQKSICSLMIEVAYADNQLDESELKAMANSLSKLDIEKEEIQEIVDATLAKSKESISFLLYLNHKDFINAKLNQKETNEDS